MVEWRAMFPHATVAEEPDGFCKHPLRAESDPPEGDRVLLPRRIGRRWLARLAADKEGNVRILAEDDVGQNERPKPFQPMSPDPMTIGDLRKTPGEQVDVERPGRIDDTRQLPIV